MPQGGGEEESEGVRPENGSLRCSPKGKLEPFGQEKKGGGGMGKKGEGLSTGGKESAVLRKELMRVDRRKGAEKGKEFPSAERT